MRLGELVNSGLTHSSATDISQNARNISMETVPMSACSFRAQNDFGAADRASAGACVCDGVNTSMRLFYHKRRRLHPPPLAGEGGEGASPQTLSLRTCPLPLRFARDLPRKRER